MPFFGLLKPNVKKMGKKRDINGLIKALNYKKDPLVRKNATRELSYLRDPKGLEPLIALLNSEQDWIVRRAIVNALEKWGKTEHLKEVLKNDKDAQIRSMAAASLGRLKEKSAVNSLTTALKNDESPEVRLQSVRSLELLGEVNPFLDTLKKDKDTKVREASLGALERHMGASAIDDFITSFENDESPVVREQLIYTLHRLGKTEHLLDVLKNDKYAGVRAAAAHVLGQLKDMQYVEPLADALNDESKLVRTSAAKELAQFTDIRALKALEEATTDPPREHGSGIDLDRYNEIMKTFVQFLSSVIEEVSEEELQRLASLKDIFREVSYYLEGDARYDAGHDTAHADYSQVRQVAQQELARRGLAADTQTFTDKDK